MAAPNKINPAGMLALMDAKIDTVQSNVNEIKAEFRAHVAELKANLTTQFVPTHEMALQSLRFAELQGAVTKLQKTVEESERITAAHLENAVTKDTLEAFQKTIEKFQATCITQDQFWPVKTIVYGSIGVTVAFLANLFLKWVPALVPS